MSKPREIFQLFKDAFDEWNADKAPRLAAALSYYTIFSIAPLLIVVIAVAGLAWGQDAVQGHIDEQIQGLVGHEGADVIQETLRNARRPQESMVATVIGLATLLLGAGGVFGQLQDALNTVWGVEAKPRGILGTIRDRFFSFTMVVGAGFLLLVSLIISAGLAALNNFLVGLLPNAVFVLQIINFLVSFGIITLLFALIFKVLPDVEIQWSDVWIGAAFTAILFTIGKTLIGLYLGNSGVASTYGAAGSLVIVLLWVYYSAQILLFGAEFTQVYARRYGSQIRPADDAVALTREAQLEQGIPRTKWERPNGGRNAKGVTTPHSLMLSANPMSATRLPSETPTSSARAEKDEVKKSVGGALIGLSAALISFAVGLLVGSKSGLEE
jgi:membrane protein